MNRVKSLRALLAVAALVGAGMLAQASASPLTILATGAAGINNSGGAVGTHYHWGPNGESQVNYSFGEIGRGVAEFDLASILAPVGSATLSFRVSGYKDIFYTAAPFEGDIDLYGYTGNNTIEVSDYESPSIGGIGSFAALGLAIGDVLQFDVTSLVNAVLGGSLGVLWDPTGASPQRTAITFDNITLAINGVPEPGMLALLGLGLAGLAAARRRR